MKRAIVFLFPFIFFLSCRENKHPDAEALCNCYAELHRTYDEQETASIADSCNQIYSEILEKYKDDKEGKEAFEEAYRQCQ